MFYSIFLVISGIYLNQEYPNLFPSIKTLTLNSLGYLRTFNPPPANTSGSGMLEALLAIFRKTQ